MGWRNCPLPNMKRPLRRLFVPPLLVLAALFMFFEEWLWERLKGWMALLGQLPLVHTVETHIAALPPKPALVVFLLPSILILPAKLAALALILRGHALAGLATILAAKLLGMALFSRIFTLCKPALLTLPWFRRMNDTILEWLARLHAWMDSWPAWRATKATLAAWRAQWKKRQFRNRFWQAVIKLKRRRNRMGD